jgi:uncharacterized damage-inducible protein DinB
MTTSNEIIEQAILRLNENTPRIEKCLQELTEEDVWHKPNASSNSVGNLILHLCGNITQYVISSLGEEKDSRDRDLEFMTEGGMDKSFLLEKLKTTVERASAVIAKLDEAELLAMRSVQGFEYSGVGNIIHVVEHYSYHTGQIAFWTKLLKDKDLEFYAGIDLNIKNRNQNEST